METQAPTIPTHHIPPPPSFYFATDIEGPDEHHVDLDDDDGELDLPSPADDPEDTGIEQVEFMGDGYRSLAHFFTGQLEDLIDPSISWILTCLDMREVQRRFEANQYRYVFQDGAVYRTGIRANPKPTPGEDPPGPWMPTRG